MGFLNTLTTPFSLMTHPGFQQDAVLHENPGVKRTEATRAKQGSARYFEVLFIGRLSTGEKKKIALKFISLFLTACVNRE